MIVARVNVDKGIGGNQARHFHLSCSSWFLLSLSVPFVFLWVFIIRSTSLFVFSTAINTRRKREREREREREQERIAPRRRYQPPQVKEKKSRFFFFGGVVFFFFFFFFFSFFFFLNLFFVSSFPFFIFASVRTTTCKEAREATIKFNEVRFEKINWKKKRRRSIYAKGKLDKATRTTRKRKENPDLFPTFIECQESSLCCNTWPSSIYRFLHLKPKKKRELACHQ